MTTVTSATDPSIGVDQPRRAVTYAIGDVHGRRDLLDALLLLIEQDASLRGAAAKIVFTGDYMDRGEDSHGVVERLIAGPRRPDDRFVCLRGNHDDLFIKAVTGGFELPGWARYLHDHTMLSYADAKEGSRADQRRLRRHAEFLSDLSLTHDDGVNFFVHAGIRPGVALDAQLDHDLIWIRDEFLNHPGPLPRRVVHGHTIIGDRPIVTPHRVSIDTGAYRSGRLTAAVFDRDAIDVLQAVGAPDRRAIVRECRLSADIEGRAIATGMQRLFDDFVLGGMDVETFALRLREIEEAESRRLIVAASLAS